MGTLMKWLGYGWAIMGLGNIVIGWFGMSGTTQHTLLLIFNMFIFVLPGMALGGIGSSIKSSGKS